MGSSKKEALRQWLENERPSQVTEAHFEELRERLTPVSEGYLRRLLRASGAALSPLVEGVVQDSFENLERTLRALAEEYERADRIRAKLIRGQVIQAKDHARWAALRSPGKALVKSEMATWLLIWLENPSLFQIWADLRLTRGQIQKPTAES